MGKGFFITLEGMEGCGKSTQCRMLGEKLSKAGREVIVTRSPGGVPSAEKIRDILKIRDESEELLPQTELLLFGACHSQMVSNLIRPALERGAVIVCDRFFDSTMAYQGYARGLDRDFVAQINEFSCGGLKPDLTLVLDIAPEKGVHRSRIRATTSAQQQDFESDRFDSEAMTFHKAVREAFLDMASKEKSRFRVIDASKNVENVHAEIMEAVNGLGLL